MSDFDSMNGHGGQAVGADITGKIIPQSDARWQLEQLETATSEKAEGPSQQKQDSQPDWPWTNDRPQWCDVTKYGAPKRTCANARVAIQAIDVSCRYDVYHDAVVIESAGIAHLSGASMDHAGHLLRLAMHDHFEFDPGKEHVHDAIIQISLMNRFDPVRDYLDGLRWDGMKRLDTFLHTYFSAEDSELNSWFGRLTLVAAVRRVREPGCKFDHILVLEGPEGTSKSSAIKLLAVDDGNFSDQTILGLSDRQQQELLRGKWIFEIGEMHGMKRSEVEQVKAFASRTHDRGRPAYGRSVVDQPRRGIMIGTTNDDHYLKSQTGNRRFWPVKTGTIDLEALARDRDQLWAEAATLEAGGIALTLPRAFWAEAKVQQEKRLELDPWDDVLESLQAEVYPAGDGKQEYRISSDEIFENWLQVSRNRRTAADASRLKNVMSRLGWQADRVYIGSSQKRGYKRPVFTE
jgi:predicted P-loop ATPase